MPWSPTVVNVNRMKKRRRSRALIVGAVVLLVACFACSLVGTFATRKPAPKPTQTIVRPAAPEVQRFVSPTAQPGWIEIQPGVSYRIEPLVK